MRVDHTPVQLTCTAGRNVLLVKRFDRDIHAPATRSIMVSALTILGLDEMQAHHASYEVLAEHIRHRFTQPNATLTELFRRMVFNILVSNTDDHARNHAALEQHWQEVAEEAALSSKDRELFRQRLLLPDGIFD